MLGLSIDEYDEDEGEKTAVANQPFIMNKDLILKHVEMYSITPDSENRLPPNLLRQHHYDFIVFILISIILIQSSFF